MSNKQKVKKIKSLFANKFVNEDSEIIQKSLIIAHQYYVSKGKYDDALKITNIISENLDKDDCFVLTAKNTNLNKYNILWNLQFGIGSLFKMLWGLFSVPGKYNSKTY